MTDNAGIIQLIESAEGHLQVLIRERNDIDTRIALQHAKIEAYRTAYKTVEHQQKHGDSARRMRLGAKKRVIYQLIQSGVADFDMLEECLRGVDKLDARYARSVVRSAINLGDMEGDVDQAFALTAFGRDILARAPLPSNWDEFEPIIDAYDGH